MFKEIFTTKRICRAGVIAALYVALCYAFMPVAYGGILQIRPAEALCILPLFFPEAVPALYIGCMLANLTSPMLIYDVFLGSLATLVAATLTGIVGYLMRNKDSVGAHVAKIGIGGFFPVVANAFIIPLIIGAISVSMAWADGSYDLVYGLENVGGEVDGGTTYIERFGDFPWWIYVVAVPIGLYLGFSQVIPGLSATAFLMLIGFFRPLVESVSVTYWSTYPQIFAFYVIMGISLIAGFILTSKLMTVLFKWNRNLVYRVIIGMSIGSILAMFLNPDALGIYVSWATSDGLSTLMIVDIALVVPLMVGGYFSSNLLVKYGDKHK